MTTSQLLLLFFAGLALIAGLIAVGLGFLIHWVARGESDVNGDPERDAGIEPAAPIQAPIRGRTSNVIIDDFSFTAADSEKPLYDK
jgi:hypothetical protein